MGASQSATNEPSTLNTIKHKMTEILKKEKAFSNAEEALQYVKEQMNCLFPLMKQIGAPPENPQAAEDYCAARDLDNIKVMEMASKEIKQLREDLEGKHNVAFVTLMSSIGAKLNLPGASDVDIGVIVNYFNLENGEHDAHMLQLIGEVLVNCGYKYDHVFNPSDPTNRYFSFVKFVDGIEVEVKVRDHATSKPIIELHSRLDNSLTREQIETYTYMKHVFAETDKKAYRHFKKLLYESMFCGISGAFLFPELAS